MIIIDKELPHEAFAREALLDRALGPERFAKACERLREGRVPAEGLAFSARAADSLVGTLRFWHIEANSVPMLMLGPLAVDENLRSFGIGSTLIKVGLAAARDLGHRAVILVGDEPYYARFGFSCAPVSGLELPGPVDRARFLGLELETRALAHAQGMVSATGDLVNAHGLGRDRRFAA